MARTRECAHTEQHIICLVCDDEGEGLGATDITTIEDTVKFVAKFDSSCGYCPEPIYEGDEVTMVVYDDDNKSTMHRDCANRAVKEVV